MNEEQQKLKLELHDLQKSIELARSQKKEAEDVALVATDNLERIKAEIEAERKKGVKMANDLDLSIEARRSEIESEKEVISALLKEKSAQKQALSTLNEMVVEATETKNELDESIRTLRSQISGAETELNKLLADIEKATTDLANEAKRLTDIKKREDDVTKRETFIIDKYKRAGIPY